MKKFLLALCLTLPAFGQIALVAHTASNSSPTSGITTTGATLLVANITAYNIHGFAHVSDSYGNTWTPVAAVQGDAAADEQLFYSINPTVGAGHTFSIQQGNLGSIQVAAFSGVTGVFPYDKSVAASGSSTTPNAGSLTPANANSLVVGGISFQNNGVVVSSITAGFTITDTSTNQSFINGSLAYQVQTSITAANPTWTLNGGSQWGATTVVFIAGSATPPGPPAPALVSHVALSGNGTSGAIDTTGASLIIVNATASSVAGGVIPTITDSKSNTWHPLTAYYDGVAIRQQTFYAWNPTVGTGHTFTATGGGGGSIQVAAFSGIKTLADPLDSQLGAANRTTGQAQGGSLTPTNPKSLLISNLSNQNDINVAIFGVDLGFKIAEITQPDNGGGVIGGAISYFVESSTTAVNPKWTSTPSAVTYGMDVSNAVFFGSSSFVSNPTIIMGGP